MHNQHGSEQDLNSLSAAVAAETGIPPGRVKKVLLSARRYEQTGPPPSSPPAPLATKADPLRFYPLGPNGRTHPPLHQPRADDAETPA
jgi:hypothetical protein